MPSVQLLFGPMLIGTFMNTMLYGVMVMQMFLYYRTYKKDSAWMRYFVLFLFLAETLNTGFDISMMYEPLIEKYGTPAATTFFPRFLAADPLMTVVISTPIQIFIAWRIRIISKTNWIPAIICLFALISFGGGIWLTFTVTVVRVYAKKPELHHPALMWLAASAVADAIITISLSISLSRRKTGFSNTDDAIDRIIRLTIQTGLVTSIFAILDVLCFLVLPHTTINFVWDFALSKLYTNALMSTLNARVGWGNLANGHTTHNILFGEESPTSSGRETYATGSLRILPVSTAAYELETQRSQAHALPPKIPDIELGLSVNKSIKLFPVDEATQ